jgi:hypothetical protein
MMIEHSVPPHTPPDYRIPENLAVGMAQLGPIMTFETLGKVLLVGLCGLTHYKRLGTGTCP